MSWDTLYAWGETILVYGMVGLFVWFVGFTIIDSIGRIRHDEWDRGG